GSDAGLHIAKSGTHRSGCADWRSLKSDPWFATGGHQKGNRPGQWPIDQSQQAVTSVDQALAIRCGGFQEHLSGSNGQVLELADVRCVDFDSVMTGSAMEGSPRILELAVDSGNVVGINSAAPMMVEQFSMGKLPFATGNFAAVVALDLLDRVPWVDVAPLLKEYRRVIHPHGALIVRVQDGNAISNRLLEHSLRDAGFETVNRI